MEVGVFFGRFVWRGINIYDVTIHPSRGSWINPTLNVCEHNRAAHASEGSVPGLPENEHYWRRTQSNLSKPLPNLNPKWSDAVYVKFSVLVM